MKFKSNITKMKKVDYKHQLEIANKKINDALKQAKFIDEQFKKFVSPIPSKEIAELIEILEKGDK